MITRVCSGFSPHGRLVYGERFLASFDRYWPLETQLRVYVEEPTIMPREAERSLWRIPGAPEIHARYGADPATQGKVPQGRWKRREIERGYSFRSDAFKFWKQILIPEAAASGMEAGDVLVWLDGDVETIRPIPAGFVEQLLGRSDVCYLGRARGHSEIGFWAVRINPKTRRFLHEIAEVYRTDKVLDLPEWHSAFVWDHVRQGSGLTERNLCPPGLTGHVWPSTTLAPYMRHDKGKRKPR